MFFKKKSNVDAAEMKKFDNEYSKQTKEILILTNDSSVGAWKAGKVNMWVASKGFLAYIDISSNELKNGDGRVVWPIEESEMQSDKNYSKKFDLGIVYRLRVRELIDKTVPEGFVPSYPNRFLVVKILEKNVQNAVLAEILAEYRKPISITDEGLGAFELEKDLQMFSGEINWLGETVSASLDIEVEDESTWSKSMGFLKSLSDNQREKDEEFRLFAAKELTELANDWSQNEEENAAGITESDFASRIRMESLGVTSDGDYTLYYFDDDMFFGHVIEITGSIDGGPESADIAG